MSPTGEVCLELFRQLRTTAALQHAWMTRLWHDERGFHPAAAGLLSVLAQHGECRPSELARRRLVDLSVVSRQITQLAEAGLIDRRPAPEDGRASLISVSEHGERELDRWRRMHAELVRSALDKWDEETLVALIDGLRGVNEDLRAVASEESLVPESARDEAVGAGESR